AEGGGEQYTAIDGVESRLQLGFLSDNFQIDEGGFDGGGAAQAPSGGEHLGDQVLLLHGDRFVHGVVVLAHSVEVATIFASKEDRVAGCAAVAEGIARGFFLSLGGLGTMGLGAVDAGAFGLSFCWHYISLAKSLDYWKKQIGHGPL